jgi:hypothetical protein
MSTANGHSDDSDSRIRRETGRSGAYDDATEILTKIDQVGHICMQLTRGVLITLWVWLPSALAGQTVVGTVRDSARATPIPSARVTIRIDSTIVGSGRTDDSGRFVIRVQRPGSGNVHIAVIGYRAFTAPLGIGPGNTVAPPYRLIPLPIVLDSVRTEEARQSFFSVTPGREQFRKHFLLGKGQFISGFEIQKSGLTASSFLATVPGLTMKRAVRSPIPGANDGGSPPTIPGRDGYLLSTNREECLYGRIDRWSIVALLDQNAAETIDDLIETADIMGVEVYLPGETPAEWRAEMKQLVWRTEGARSYLIGDTGQPQVKRGRIRADPRDPFDNRPSPMNVWVSNVDPFTAVGATPPATDARRRPRNAAYLIAASVAPPSFELPNMRVPHCAYVQIWTKVAWNH